MSTHSQNEDSFDVIDSQIDERLEVDRRSGSSYSLLLLFYLTTLTAIVAAAVRLSFLNEHWGRKTFLIGYAITGMLGVIVCTLIGYLIGRTVLSSLLGLLCGLLCGLLAILMTFIEPSHYTQAALLLGVGSWIMIVIALINQRVQS